MALTTKHTYEIYTRNPETGERGWDIVFVYASRENIESYPNFDCIVTVDDAPHGTPVVNFL